MYDNGNKISMSCVNLFIPKLLFTAQIWVFVSFKQWNCFEIVLKLFGVWGSIGSMNNVEPKLGSG